MPLVPFCVFVGFFFILGFLFLLGFLLVFFVILWCYFFVCFYFFFIFVIAIMLLIKTKKKWQNKISLHILWRSGRQASHTHTQQTWCTNKSRRSELIKNMCVSLLSVLLTYLTQHIMMLVVIYGWFNKRLILFGFFFIFCFFFFLRKECGNFITSVILPAHKKLSQYFMRTKSININTAVMMFFVFKFFFFFLDKNIWK